MTISTSTERKVWYASYGSNLLEDRFLCYILGGTPKGAKKHNPGTTDRTLPGDDQPVIIPYRLYFAEKAGSWENAGVAFLSGEKDESEKTLGRQYLITEKQFIQVVMQENSMDPEQDTLDIDLNEAIRHGSMSLGTEKWYGKIVYLGDMDGYPSFTFTSDKARDPQVPGFNYLRTIAAGIRDTYGFTDAEIAEYFTEKSGVKDNLDVEEIVRELSVTS